MNDKLTVKQFRELVGFHNKAVSGKVRTRSRTRIITDPDEIAKLTPGILSRYVIRDNRSGAKAMSSKRISA